MSAADARGVALKHVAEVVCTIHRSSPRGATKMSNWGPFANASVPMQSPLTAD